MLCICQDSQHTNNNKILMSQSTFLSEALFSTKWDIGNWYQFLLTTKREFNQQEIGSFSNTCTSTIYFNQYQAYLMVWKIIKKVVAISITLKTTILFNFSFAVIIIKMVLLSFSWSKDSKTVLGIRIGSWEVSFYSGITHGQTNGRTDRPTSIYILKSGMI